MAEGLISQEKNGNKSGLSKKHLIPLIFLAWLGCRGNGMGSMVTGVDGTSVSIEGLCIAPGDDESYDVDFESKLGVMTEADEEGSGHDKANAGGTQVPIQQSVRAREAIAS